MSLLPSWYGSAFLESSIQLRLRINSHIKRLLGSEYHLITLQTSALRTSTPASSTVESIHTSPYHDRIDQALMNFPGHRKENETDSFSQQDAMPYSNYFDNPHLNDAYLQMPGYSMNTFFDSESFYDQSLTSVDMVPGGPKPQATFDPTLPATGMSASSSDQPLLGQIFPSASIGQVGQYPDSFTFNPIPTQPNELDCFSPTTGTTSQAPSSGGDTPLQTTSPSLSPHMLKRTSPSPSSGSEFSTPKRPTRKRGRPKPERSNPDPFITSSPTITSPSARSKRLPHNQVERKYREGLNSELERLRQAVPVLRREGEKAGALRHPKPSKAMVLSSAIEHIQRLEKERDKLREENERLRKGEGWYVSVGEDGDGFSIEG
jgi:hypothetical protein